MPKINFNVPILKTDGTELTRPKADQTKIQKSPDGRLMADPIFDENGILVTEPVGMPEILSNLLNKLYIGETDMSHEERLARGKLCRKIADTSALSKKNYSFDEITILKEVLVKSGVDPVIIAQIEEIIEGGEYTKEELQTTNNTIS